MRAAGASAPPLQWASEVKVLLALLLLLRRMQRCLFAPQQRSTRLGQALQNPSCLRLHCLFHLHARLKALPCSEGSGAGAA